MRHALWVLGFLAIAACDPVHSAAVDALGGEMPGVGHGPLHRPGQPCLVCHDGALGDPAEFSVAGTVFVRPSDRQPAAGATIDMKSADGSAFSPITNSAGNFYVRPSEWAPVYPLQVSVRWEDRVVDMQTNIGGDGSCAACHGDPAGPASAGHVYVVSEDGGAVP
jgi:hypothetical protein